MLPLSFVSPGEEQIINVSETGGIGALDYEAMYC